MRADSGSANRPGAHRSDFRADIEGLRGIAVLLVVTYHCGLSFTSGGFVGVDVFFVLSGYLITGLLVSEVRETGGINLLEFYARRVRRLLPASALMLAATLVTAALFLAPQELHFAGRAARAAALYMSNVFFATNAADYFAPNVKSNPLLHTWSLAVEEQFYLFWPLLILSALQLFRSTKTLLAFQSAVTLVSFIACVYWTAAGGPFAFYQLPARAWEFGIGGMAVLLPRGSSKVPHILSRALSWFGLLAILASAAFMPGTANFPGWLALLPVLATAAILIAGADLPNCAAAPLLHSRPLQLLGKLSYSWYLWHWPFLVFSLALFPNITLAGKLTAALASLAVAAIAHYLFENPIRLHPSLLPRPAFCLGLAALVSVLSLTAASFSMRYASGLANSPPMKNIAAAATDISSMPREQCVALAQTSAVKTCVFGNATSPVRIVLFGDSHAIQWFNPLRRIAESHDWKLTTAVKSGCPATDIAPEGNIQFDASCAQWRAAAIRAIQHLRPSVVFVANASIYLGRPSSITIRDWRGGTRRTLEALTAAGLEVVSVRDTPIPAFDVPNCLARSLRRSGSLSTACQMNRAAVLDPAIFEAEQAAAAGLPRIHFLDLTAQLCRANICAATQDGEAIYRDDNHLTGKAAERLAPALESQLLPVINSAPATNPAWAFAKLSSFR
ncbi:MAG: acyltransferase [Acidobacteriia bacterium]|nr:acyltransferase [Terriglobia bacterium]